MNPCWDEAISIGPSQNPKYAGKTLREIGRLLGTSSMEAVMALLLEEPRIPIEENKKRCV